MASTRKPNRGDAVIERVTNELIAAIEAGAGAWKMPWVKLGSTDTPRNVDGRFYRGMNVIILHFTALELGYTSGVWATYDGWAKKGGQVRKGEKSTEVILWKPYTRKAEAGEDAGSGEDGERKSRGGLMVRSFRVFAAEQQDGWELPAAPERNSPERLAHAEEFFAAIGADVRHGGNSAYYNKLSDYVQVPNLDQFDTAPHYYSTLGHEHIHWTGHKSRLDRDMGKRFGDDAYGAEELVAELGAALLSAKLGIDAATRQDHAAYLSSWLRVLKQDARSLVTVMSKAQAAIDHLDKCAGQDGGDIDLTDDADETPAERQVA